MNDIIFHGKMPDPFKKEDGTRVTPEEWKEYKKGILEQIVDIDFGGMPPRPEVVEVELITEIKRGSATPMFFKVWAGTKEKQLTFMLELNVPVVEGVSPPDLSPIGENEIYPVILTGDGCYHNMARDVIEEINSHGFIAARFNRLEIESDTDGNLRGGIHDIYEGDYSDISAWAWGYLVCIDVFEKLSFVDDTEIAITGHSRGGKTVLLAAAVDERVKYVCPNNSGCHGANSYRCEVHDQGDVGWPTETLDHMHKGVKRWLGPKLEQYRKDVSKLPYDMHYFGAMIAPRFYLQCEGMQDYWINPIGAWQNFAAVKECYTYLGCPDHAGAWFREGFHRHRVPDYLQFINFIEKSKKGLPLSEHLKTNPYPDIKKNFDW